MTSFQNTISVIIRTRTNDSAVLELLRRLNEQTLQSLETIIVDSGSSQNLLEAFASQPNTRLIQIPGESYTSAGALNRGCVEARGSLIASLSQDALPESPRYLEALSEAFSDAAVAGAYGRQVPRADDHPLNVKDLSKTYPPQSRTQMDECWFDNCCSMFRADLWRRHPFDEAYVISEDHAWGQWAIEQGYLLRYEAEATVIHSHDRTVQWLWKRFYGEGQGLAKIHGQPMTLRRALYVMSRTIAGDWIWMWRNGRMHQALLPLVDRPVKFGALWMGYRRGRAGQSSQNMI